MDSCMHSLSCRHVPSSFHHSAYGNRAAVFLPSLHGRVIVSRRIACLLDNKGFGVELYSLLPFSTMTEEAPQIPNLLLTPALHSSIRVLVNDMLSHVQPPSTFSTMVLLLIAFTSWIGHAFIYILPILSLSLIPKRKPGTAKLTSARFPRHAVVINCLFHRWFCHPASNGMQCSDLARRSNLNSTHNTSIFLYI